MVEKKKSVITKLAVIRKDLLMTTSNCHKNYFHDS